MSERLEHLLNIGPRTAQWLREIGVTDRAALEREGSINAFTRLKARYPGRVTHNALYALEGALLDVRWNALPPARQRALEAELASLEQDA